jgi:hypothetical protein
MIRKDVLLAGARMAGAFGSRVDAGVWDAVSGSIHTCYRCPSAAMHHAP